MSEATLSIFLFIGLLTDFNIGRTFGKHGVVDPRELMSSGGNRLLTTMAGFDAPVESTQGGLTATQSGGGKAERLGGSISIALDLFA